MTSAVTQGTKVKIDFTITDYDTGLAYDPADVAVRVERPSGAVDEYRALYGQVVHRVDDQGNPIVGSYRCVIDTSPESGRWTITILPVGRGDQVERSRSFTVWPAFYVPG